MFESCQSVLNEKHTTALRELLERTNLIYVSVLNLCDMIRLFTDSLLLSDNTP